MLLRSKNVLFLSLFICLLVTSCTTVTTTTLLRCSEDGASCIPTIIYPLPEKPQYYELKWNRASAEEKVFYCLDEEGAKALLLNKALDDDYRERLHLIIDKYEKSMSVISR